MTHFAETRQVQQTLCKHIYRAYLKSTLVAKHVSTLLTEINRVGLGTRTSMYVLYGLSGIHIPSEILWIEDRTYIYLDRGLPHPPPFISLDQVNCISL